MSCTDPRKFMLISFCVFMMIFLVSGCVATSSRLAAYDRQLGITGDNESSLNSRNTYHQVYQDDRVVQALDNFSRAVLELTRSVQGNTGENRDKDYRESNNTVPVTVGEKENAGHLDVGKTSETGLVTEQTAKVEEQVTGTTDQQLLPLRKPILSIQSMTPLKVAVLACYPNADFDDPSLKEMPVGVDMDIYSCDEIESLLRSKELYLNPIGSTDKQNPLGYFVISKFLIKDYMVDIFESYLKKDIGHLLSDPQAKAIFMSNGIVRIYDRPVGHGQVMAYIDALKHKGFVQYSYNIQLNSATKLLGSEKILALQGIITPMTPIPIGSGMIQISLKADMLFISVSYPECGIQMTGVLPKDGGPFNLTSAKCNGTLTLSLINDGHRGVGYVEK